jgi:hypothetical protein
VVYAVSRSRSRGRARRAGCCARLDVAGGWTGLATLLVRPFPASTARAAPRDRRRGRRRGHRRVACGRRRYVRGNHARQRTHPQHSDARRLQRHADACRVAGGASRNKRGGGSDCRPRRCERSAGGRRALRASRDPPRKRRGRIPRSSLVPPAETGGVAPRAAGPSRACVGRRHRPDAGRGAGARRSRAGGGAAGVGAGRSCAALVFGLARPTLGRAPVRSAERTD